MRINAYERQNGVEDGKSYSIVAIGSSLVYNDGEELGPWQRTIAIATTD